MGCLRRNDFLARINIMTGGMKQQRIWTGGSSRIRGRVLKTAGIRRSCEAPIRKRSALRGPPFRLRSLRERIRKAV
jgi:hypothetical protein